MHRQNLRFPKNYKAFYPSRETNHGGPVKEGYSSWTFLPRCALNLAENSWFTVEQHFKKGRDSRDFLVDSGALHRNIVFSRRNIERRSVVENAKRKRRGRVKFLSSFCCCCFYRDGGHSLCESTDGKLIGRRCLKLYDDFAFDGILCLLFCYLWWWRNFKKSLKSHFLSDLGRRTPKRKILSLSINTCVSRKYVRYNVCRKQVENKIKSCIEERYRFFRIFLKRRLLKKITKFEAVEGLRLHKKICQR